MFRIFCTLASVLRRLGLYVFSNPNAAAVGIKYALFFSTFDKLGVADLALPLRLATQQWYTLESNNTILCPFN